jgi:flagellar P-ring protein precursor FlgI
VAVLTDEARRGLLPHRLPISPDTIHPAIVLKMQYKYVAILTTAIVSAASSVPAHGQPQVRIGDVTTLAGEHENKLSGLGLVVGLAGTGGTGEMTKRLLVNYAQRLGLRADPATRQLIIQLQEKTDNVSAVSVTAILPPHAKAGQKIDVTVSTLDDAESLAGGTLIATPLEAFGEVYALAAGPVSLNGGSFGGQAANVTINHPTVGRVSNGAVVEQEVPSTIFIEGRFRLLLNEPSFENARRVAESINLMAPGAAVILDPAAVEVRYPQEQFASPHEFVAACQEQLIVPDGPALVVINERTGTIAFGQHVKVSTAGIAHGNLYVTTEENQQVSQPGPFSEGETEVVDRTNVDVAQQQGFLNVVNETATVGDLVASLNALGVTPRDLSIIFQMLKETGALHATIELK